MIKNIYKIVFFIYQHIVVKFLIALGIKGQCVFNPTCSEYSAQAFQKYPFHTALYLTAKRVSRCRPHQPFTYDPLPEVVD